MSAPQRGIFVEGSRSNHYLEYRARAGVDAADLRAGVATALGLNLAVGQHLVVAFGATLWHRLAPDRVPPGLRPFEPLGDPAGQHAPATQRDIWFWIQGAGPDDNLDLAIAVDRALQGAAVLELEVVGFQYHGNRDLIGFVDGTANPKDKEAKEAAALVPESGGGAFLFTQQWLHDLAKFKDLGVAEQESVVGRTKVEDIELEGAAMPPTSHVSRTDASEAGVAMKIYRRSSPFGGVAQLGLYFVAFACDLRRVEIQLERMYGVAGDGLSDRLIEFSRAVTGAYWYAPGTDDLAAVFGARLG